MKKIIIFMFMAILLVGCAGEKVGDEFQTDSQVCTTTMEYKWVWSIFDDSGFKKIPVTTCEGK